MTQRRADLLVILGLAAATVAVTWPVLSHPRGLRVWVADVHKDYADAAFIWRTVYDYRQFPFRSPWHGGGYPMVAYPEDIVLSPRVGLVLAFGPWAGLKLDYALTMFLAASGAYLLLRRSPAGGELPVPAAAVAAVTFAFGGFFLGRWNQGWLVTCRGAVFPWLLYFWRLSRRNVLWLAAVAGGLAALLLDGKYAAAVLLWFMLLWLTLGLEAPGESPPTFGRLTRRFGILALTVVWAALLAAVKLVPLVPLLRAHFELGRQGQPASLQQTALWVILLALMFLARRVARSGDRSQALSPSPPGAEGRGEGADGGRHPIGRRRAWFWAAALILAAVGALLLLCPRDDAPGEVRSWECERRLLGLLSFGFLRSVKEAAVPQGVPVWDEGSPVGVVGVALALLAVLWWGRRLWRWVVLALILLWIDLGAGVPLNLQSSVRRLPVLNVLRNPPAWFNLYLLFAAAVLAGHGVMVLVDWLGGWGRRLIPWTAAVLSLAYLGAVAWQRYPYTVAVPVGTTGPEGDYHLVKYQYRNENSHPLLIYRNIGLVDWGEDLVPPWPRAVEPRFDYFGGPRNHDYHGEAYFFSGGPNQARITHFSPNEIRVEVDVEQPDVLCLNQVRDFNWRTNEGRLSDASYTLGVALSRLGRYEVRLRYFPPAILWGAGVSILSLILGLSFLPLLAGGRATRSPAGGG